MQQIKLVIWDLDETFWKGILSEGEVVLISENIKIVKTLTDRGIINSICSKNDYEMAKNELEKAGIWDYFVFSSINWDSKGSRVKQIVDNMQLQATNVVFIDDNINNLREVEVFCRGIHTTTPDNFKRFIMNNVFLGNEDYTHKRLSQYKLLEKKAIAKVEIDNNEKFLFQSQIVVEMIENNIDHIERIYEMIHRNNQLNFTKKLISKEEVRALFLDCNVRSGVVRVTDKYGDHGIVGCYAVRSGIIEQFVFSCRIIGMGVEQYVYAELGFPKIQIIGNVAGKLSTGFQPKWINSKKPLNIFSENTETQAIDSTSKLRKQTPKLLIYGGCILRPIHGYVEAKLDESNAIYDYPGSPLSVMNISGIWRYTPEKRKEWQEGISIFHPNSYDKRLSDSNLDYLLVSLQLEFSFSKYQHKFKSDICFYSRKLTNLNACSYVLGNYWEIPITAEDIIKELSYIAEHIAGKLVILTLPDYIKIETGEDAEYFERLKLNNIADTLAEKYNNIVLLDMRKFMRSSADSLDGSINHYTREIGYKIAMNLLEIMGVREKKEETKYPIPQNAVKIKNSNFPLELKDVPEYITYIRNGYYYVDVVMSHAERYEIKYICRLNRKIIEVVDYSTDFNYKRALTQVGLYWMTITLRDKACPQKEYCFDTQQIPYNEWIVSNYFEKNTNDFDDHIAGLSEFFSQYSNAVSFRRRWTEQLIFLKTYGITIADYFKKKNIQNVSLFADVDMYPVILQTIQNVDFCLKYKFVDDWIFELYPECGFSTRHLFDAWSDSCIGVQDTVLIAKTDIAFFGGDTGARIKAINATPVFIYDVINELITDLLFNKMLPQMLIDKRLDVPIIVFQTPNSEENLISLSKSDKLLINFDEKTLLEAKRNNSDSLPDIYQDIPLEELEETLKYPLYYRLTNGVMSMQDVSGKYRNIINGRRNTVGQPSTYIGTIYMFGHQGMFGAGVRDEDTIASKLQAILPEYRVENCSNYWSYTEWESNMLGLLIKSIEFKKGDIICIQSQSRSSSFKTRTFRFEAIEKPCYKLDCNLLFNKPNQPNLFLLPYSSLAPWGNQKVAEQLRDKIIEIVAKNDSIF